MNGTALKIDNENLAGKAGYYISLFGAALFCSGSEFSNLHPQKRTR
jgi:hypothetical protein